MIKKVCVFCGGLSGNDEAYLKGAEQFGRLLVENEIGLVYGGGSVGLMGAVADAVLKAGGVAVGVIPESLVNREIGHNGLSELIVVDTMHERKAKMAELADAFVALPGGYGTLEELFEIITLTIIEAQSKPCGIYNILGYYNHLLHFLDEVAEQGFITREDREFLVVEEDPALLLAGMESMKPYKSTRWQVMAKTRKH
ncbi:MAG: TIGR00730 family Rossman fold protein [Cyanobacteriota/Melainabacteria group bacterium]